MLLAKVSNKIVETLSLIIGVLRRTKQSAPLSLALHSNLRCLLFVTGSSYSVTTLLGGDSVGKAAPFPFEVGKMQAGHLMYNDSRSENIVKFLMPV